MAASVGVRVRYYAGAAAAAGVVEETHTAATLGGLLDEVFAAHGDGLARVLRAASVLVDGEIERDGSRVLVGGQTVDILPPFAGG